MPHHSAETKAAAKGRFIYHGQSVAEIAREMGINPRSIFRWKSEDLVDWERERQAHLLKPSAQESQGYTVTDMATRQFVKVLEQLEADTEIKPMERVEMLSKAGTAYSRTINAMRRAAPEVNKYAIALEVLKLLSDFVKEEHPAHAGALAGVIVPFGQRVGRLLK